jgi:hypothetical protein
MASNKLHQGKLFVGTVSQIVKKNRQFQIIRPNKGIKITFDVEYVEMRIVVG